MRTVAVMLFASSLVVGCQTFDQMTDEQKKALVEKTGEDCKAFGYRPGTNAFAQCVQVAIIQNDNKVDRKRKVVGAAIANASTTYGNSLSAASRNRINCTSRRNLSGTVQTTCY